MCALNQYLNHTNASVFTVHRCSSLIFGKQRAERIEGSESSTFQPGLRQKRVQDCLPATFTIRAICHLATRTDFFCYIRASSVSRQNALFSISRVISGCHTEYFSGFFSHRERLLLRPKGSYLLMRTLLRRRFLLADSHLPESITAFRQSFSAGILAVQAETTLRLEVLAYFIHRVKR